MEKCLWVSKNLFLASEYVSELIYRNNTTPYVPSTKWKSRVLLMFLSDILKIEDSEQGGSICILWVEKCILRLEIDSLRPKGTFPYPEYISRTIRTTLRNHSKSSPWFLLYFTFKKGSKLLIFGLVFCNFLDSESWYQKSLLGAEKSPKVLQKTL